MWKKPSIFETLCLQEFLAILSFTKNLVIWLPLEITLEKVNITSSVASSTGVGLQWKPPDTLKLGEHVKSYVIEIVDLLRGESFNYTVNSSMTSADLNILKPYTPYEFKVYGVTSSWEGNITDVINIKTQEDGRLRWITNFKA